MKKFFVILAAVAMIANVACTKVEKKTTDQKISFSVANYVPATKAGEVSFLSEFSDAANAKFNCKAYMKGVGVDGMQNFFGTDGEIISWNATDKEWAPSHDYYWPKDDESYVNFFSWYDTGAGPAVTNGTMKWENRVIGTGDNIMYADPAWRFQKNLGTYKLDGVTEGVPTLFHHALAQVEIRAYAEKLTDGTATWTIKLTDVALSVYNKGSLTLTATEPTEGYNIKGEWNNGTTPAWTTSGSVSDIISEGTSGFAVTATSADAAAAKLLSPTVVLPQSVASVNLTFNLDITTTYGSGETAVSHHEIIPQTIALGNAGFATADNAWKLNTKYIYNILIKPSEKVVLFDPAVEAAWTELSYAKEL